MHRDTIDAAPDALDTTYTPETIIDRDDQQDHLQDAFTDPGARNLYLHGPRGTGKTLLARSSLDNVPDKATTAYISCLRFDTQYRVLRQLYRLLTGDDINNGYHTAQLQHRVQDLLASRDLLLVLDEIDFLLEHDGDDLLYFLSRMNTDANIGLVAISANNPDPRAVIDQRTLSSMQPLHVPFDRYPAEQAYDILQARLQEAGMFHAVNRDALTFLVTRTRNIQIGLHWLALASTTAEDRITVDLLRDTKSAAEQRYRDDLLSGFTTHHQLLFEAISQLCAERDDTVRSGVIYDRYTDLCQSTDTDGLSTRRVSEFLTDLELLDIVEVDHVRGGTDGRTRKIRLTQFL